MDVRVDHSRNQKLAAPIDDRDSRRDGCLCAGYLRDFSTAHDHPLICRRRSPRPIDDRDVLDDEFIDRCGEARRSRRQDKHRYAKKKDRAVFS